MNDTRVAAGIQSGGDHALDEDAARRFNAAMASPASSRFEIRTALLALVVGALLLGIKFTAFVVTGSAAIFSDALETIVNVLASGFALWSLVLAHTPADARHPYGHGKVEFISAGSVGAMMLIAALVIVARAVEDIIRGPVIEQLNLGLLLIVLTLPINAALGLYLIRVGRRQGSITLEADGRHVFSDVLTSAGVLVALGLVWLTGWTMLDPLAALAVAGYIVWVAVGLLRRSAAGLMDAQDERDERLLKGILDAHVGPDGRPPRICSYHKLRHRHSGRYHWVDFHLMVPARWNVEQGHRTASAIEHEIEQALGEGNATAHVEPCPEEDCPLCAQPSASPKSEPP